MENGNIQDQEKPVIETAVVETPVADKTFTQSELNKIVGRVREDARQDAYNRAKAELEAKQSQQSVGGMEQIDPEQINRMIEDKIQERVRLAEAHKTVENFLNKVKAAESKYPGLEERVEKLNLAAAPHIVQWANSFDNTADILKEFTDNPAKYAQVVMLSQFSPDSARQLMVTLSDSIKKNQEALKQPKVDEPLSQISPSSVGTDNGSMTLEDYKRQDWLRG